MMFSCWASSARRLILGAVCTNSRTRFLMLQPQHMMPSQLTRGDPTQHCAVRQGLARGSVLQCHHLSDLSPSFSLPVTLRKWSGSYVHVSPRPCSSAIDGQACNPPTGGTTPSVQSVLSRPYLALSPPHVCHRQGTGLSPHTQQEMVISGAPPHPNTRVPSVSKKADIFSHGDTCLAPCHCVIDPRRADVPRARRSPQRICISPLLKKP